MNLIGKTKQAIETVEKKNNEERCKEAFYVSDANKCARQIYYSLDFKKPLEDTDALSGLRMNAGKKIEESIIEYWKEAGMLVKEQVRIEEKVGDKEIHGYADAIIKGEDTDIPVEIKSFYGYYQAKELRENRPNPNYVAQLALYTHFLGFKHGKLFYIDRSDMSMFEFDLYLDDEGNITCGTDYMMGGYGNIQDHIDTFARVAADLKKGTPPRHDYDYKWDLQKFEHEVKGWSKSKIDAEIKKFRPIDRVMSEPDDKGKKKVLGYSYGGHLYPKKDEAHAAYYADIKDGHIPQLDAVHGDWNCKYCDYKKHCLESRGIELGYSVEEFTDRLDILENVRSFI